MPLEGHKGEISKLIIKEGKDFLYSSCMEGEIRVWNLEKKELDAIYSLPGGVKAFTLDN